MFSEKDEEEEVLSVRPSSSTRSSIRMEGRESAEEAESCVMDRSGGSNADDVEEGWYDAVVAGRAGDEYGCEFACVCVPDCRVCAVSFVVG